MICEVMAVAPESFLVLWAILTIIMVISTTLFSGSAFFFYFARPTYERWRYKINPKFPEPYKVRLEYLQMLKGVVTATFLPTLSMYLVKNGASKAYCGVGEYGWGYLIASFFVCWVVADVYEFAYHYLGHRFEFMWAVHKHHHIFPNPSPFAVIADEPVDQFFRAAPIALFPMIAPLNMDMLLFLFGFFFYAWGVVLHWGFEFDWPNAHHPWINTSYHHFAHHALSVMKKPYHNGFYVQTWDNIMGSVYPKEKCFCSKCAREKGEREFEAWEKIEKPDYSVLLSPKFWIFGDGRQAKKHA
jgi:lathosterol oxidase